MSMKIRCIAVDDEPLALDQMKEFIKKIPYLELLESFKNGLDAMSFMKSSHVDLMFLDIQMDDISGIQMLETLKQKPCVVLTTAYDEYALKGYELEVCDYLLKPISFERFVQAVEKVYSALQVQPVTADNGEGGQIKEKQEFIFVKADYKMQKVNFDEILFVEGRKDYLKIQTKAGIVMPLMSFKKLMSFLPPERFIRVHKSFVVAVDKINTIGKNSLNIESYQIPVGEYYKKSFFDFLESKKLM